MVSFYNQRGTAAQWIKAGKTAIKWLRLCCRTVKANAVRLQPHALADNLSNVLRTLALPDERHIFAPIGGGWVADLGDVDQETPFMPNDMQTTAKATKVDMTTEFSQVALLQQHHDIAGAVGSPSGICYGLSFVWLGYKAKKQTEALFDALADDNPQPVFYRAAYIYKVVQSTGQGAEAKAAEMCGLKEAKTGDNTKSMTVNIGSEANVREMVAWFNSARSDRFFTLSTHEHTMAAAGNGRGRSFFFDPNFGVVATNNASNMVRFFQTFFRIKRIKDAYFGNIGGRQLSVRKYKPA